MWRFGCRSCRVACETPQESAGTRRKSSLSMSKGFGEGPRHAFDDWPSLAHGQSECIWVHGKAFLLTPQGSEPHAAKHQKHSETIGKS